MKRMNALLGLGFVLGFCPLRSAEADPAYNYVIITTNYISANSTKLDDYIAHRTAQGYSILVKTVESIEAEYTKALRPTLFETTDERADRIKAYLKDKYLTYGFEYVLFIGNPDPDDVFGSPDSVGISESLALQCSTEGVDHICCAGAGRG